MPVFAALLQGKRRFKKFFFTPYSPLTEDPKTRNPLLTHKLSTSREKASVSRETWALLIRSEGENAAMGKDSGSPVEFPGFRLKLMKLSQALWALPNH